MMTATLHQVRRCQVKWFPRDEAKGVGPWVTVRLEDDAGNRVNLVMFGEDQAKALMVCGQRGAYLLATGGRESSVADRDTAPAVTQRELTP
jgi:hypothetical protein